MKLHDESWLNYTKVKGAVKAFVTGKKKLSERAASDKGALKQGSLLENEKMEKKEENSISWSIENRQRDHCKTVGKR